MDAITYHLFVSVFILGVIMGIRLMSSPRTAVQGNLLGAICILGAVILTLSSNGVLGVKLLWVSMAIGGLLGYLLAVKVTMLQMPQLVALFNGFGGGASAMVAVVLFCGSPANTPVVTKCAGALALSVGGLTFSGSLVAAAKLSRVLPQRPIRLRGHATLNLLALAGTGVLAALTAVSPVGDVRPLALANLLIALLFGTVFTIRIGGADMPITISLLNSLSGVAAAITGFAVGNALVVAVGAVVGAAGLILTQIMCRAMNRSLAQVLTGKTTSAGIEQARAADGGVLAGGFFEPAAPNADKETTAVTALRNATNVVIVPGYGMALAQAQHQVKQLADELERRDKNVKFGIHPVAGRMPGHMHVLLAEAEVPYEKLYEMNDINPEFKETDVAIVVGANDVVNPAASTAEGTPIYGMPILQVDEARYVIVCNLDTQPGYAGVANPLYERDNVALFLGDAAVRVRDLMEKLAEA